MNLQKRLLSSLLPLTVLVAAGCGAEDASGESGTTGEALVTYHGDVLPILMENCAGCHVAKGIGPFVVDDYEVAKSWGEAMDAAVAARTMPPFNANNDGSCNTYEDALWLSDEEIATIGAWVEGGMVEGTPAAETPLAPEPNVLLGDDIEDLTTPADYLPIAQSTPGQEFDDYQCFIVSDPQVAERYLTGYDVVAGNPAAVHHALAFSVDPSASSLPDDQGNTMTNGELMQLLDDASPDQPGWDCFAAAGDGVYVQGVPVAWAPGQGAVNFPAGTGVKVNPGEVWVVQMHYNLANTSESDTTTIELSYTDTVEAEGTVSLWDEFLFSAVLGMPAELPPGQEDATYSWTNSVGAVTGLGNAENIDIYGLLPHMHKRGRSMSIRYGEGDAQTCGMNVDRWDFDWQRFFFYEQPVRVSGSDPVEVTCSWDTRGETDPVLPGFGTDAEMCLVGFYAVAR